MLSSPFAPRKSALSRSERRQLLSRSAKRFRCVSPGRGEKAWRGNKWQSIEQTTGCNFCHFWQQRPFSLSSFQQRPMSAAPAVTVQAEPATVLRRAGRSTDSARMVRVSCIGSRPAAGLTDKVRGALPVQALNIVSTASRHRNRLGRRGQPPRRSRRFSAGGCGIRAGFDRTVAVFRSRGLPCIAITESDAEAKLQLPDSWFGPSGIDRV